MESKKIKKKYFQFTFLVPLALAGVFAWFLYYYHQDVIGYILIGDIGLIGGFIICFLVLLVYSKKFLNKVKLQKKISKLPLVIHSFFTLLAIVAIVVAGALIHPYSSAENYKTGPVLTWGSDQDPSSEITVIWQTKCLKPSVVSYGTDPSELTEKIELENRTIWHSVVLPNLSANTKYYYEVEGLEAGVHSFTTAPASSEEKNFTFLVAADMRQNSGVLGMFFQPNVPASMEKDMKSQGIQPAFSIYCGDTVSEGTDTATWKSWFEDISVSTDIGSNAPIQIAVGNHERHDDCEGDIFEEHYPYENKPHFYYSYNYSNIHFTMLDPWNETDCWWGEFTQTQLDWLENDLNNSAEMEHNLVFMHPPPIRDGEIKEEYEPFIQIMDDYDVDAVFYGHAHDFESSTINDTKYFLIGVGGNNGGNAQPPGYVQVNASSAGLQLTMNWLNGTRQDLGFIE